MDQFREAGFSAKELHEALKLTAKELKDGGFAAAEIKAVGFKPYALKALGMLV